MVQVKDWLAVARPSETDAVMLYVRANVGWPEMRPDELFNTNPDGKPEALKVSELPSGSVARRFSATGLVMPVSRLPGAVKVGGLFAATTVQVKPVPPVKTPSLA